MATDPLDTLFFLDEASKNLDMVQSWVTGARVLAAENQSLQLELDRQQADIDRKRALIELTMLDISSRN